MKNLILKNGIQNQIQNGIPKHIILTYDENNRVKSMYNSKTNTIHYYEYNNDKISQIINIEFMDKSKATTKYFYYKDNKFYKLVIQDQHTSSSRIILIKYQDTENYDYSEGCNIETMINVICNNRLKYTITNLAAIEYEYLEDNTVQKHIRVIY